MAEGKERAVGSMSQLPCPSKGLNYQWLFKYRKAGISPYKENLPVETYYAPVSLPSTLCVSFLGVIVTAP